MVSSRRSKVVPVSAMPSVECFLVEPLPMAYEAEVNSQKPLAVLMGT